MNRKMNRFLSLVTSLLLLTSGLGVPASASAPDAVYSEGIGGPGILSDDMQLLATNILMNVGDQHTISKLAIPAVIGDVNVAVQPAGIVTATKSGWWGEINILLQAEAVGVATVTVSYGGGTVFETYNVTVQEKPQATGIEIQGPSALFVGQGVTLLCKGLPAGADVPPDAVVEWTSSNSGVVDVELTTGEAGGAGVGTATVTATATFPDSTQWTDTLDITVSPLVQTDYQLTLRRGETESVSLSGWNVPIENAVMSVYPKSVASATLTGGHSTLSVVVYGKAVGSAVVTVTSDGQTRYVQVTVEQAPAPGSLKIWGPAEVPVGGTAKLGHSILPEDAWQGVTWTPSDPTILDVSPDGTVTGIAAGTAQVTATTDEADAGGQKLNATLSIEVVVPPVTVTITGGDYVKIGEQLQLTAAVTPATVPQDVLWESEDGGMATVDANGLVTGVAPGTVKIKATSLYDTNVYDEHLVQVNAEAAQYASAKLYITNRPLRDTQLQIPGDGTEVSANGLVPSRFLHSDGHYYEYIGRARVGDYSDVANDDLWTTLATSSLGLRINQGAVEYNADGTWNALGSQGITFYYQQLENIAEIGDPNVSLTVSDWWDQDAPGPTGEIAYRLVLKVYELDPDTMQVRAVLYDSGRLLYYPDILIESIAFGVNTSAYRLVRVEKGVVGGAVQDITSEYQTNGCASITTNDELQFVYAYVVPKGFNVTYVAPDADDPSVVPADGTTYMHNDTVTVKSSPVPTRAGYTFLGWGYGGSTYKGGDTFRMPPNDVTLTAQWSPTEYSITYVRDPAAGGVLSSYGELVSAISAPQGSTVTTVNAGYTFAGWWAADGTRLTTNLTFVPVLRAAATYTAKFTPDTPQPETTSVSVTKDWQDSNNQDGVRPASVDVYLTKGGTRDATTKKTLDINNSWGTTWTGLPVKENGQTVAYGVEEYPTIGNGYTSQVTGSMAAGFILTNSRTPETTSVSVTKDWQDGNNQDGVRPASVDVYLTKGGTRDATTKKTLDINNSWGATWTGLPVKENGQTVAYGVVEYPTIGNGYTSQVTGSMAAGFILTNSRTPETTSVSVSKSWDDRGNADGIRPDSVNVYLTKGGSRVPNSTKKLGDGNPWSTSWTGLQKRENGSLVSYGVGEESIPGYTPHITGGSGVFTIRNEHIPELTSMSVVKHWNDGGNAGGTRPASILVQLYAGTTPEGAPVSLSPTNLWQYTWTRLPYGNPNNPISYSVVELNTPNTYRVVVTKPAPSVTLITNTLITTVVTPTPPPGPGLLLEDNTIPLGGTAAGNLGDCFE